MLVGIVAQCSWVLTGSEEDPGDGVKVPIGQPYRTMADALVDDWGKAAATEALGVNYRTMMACYESRHVSRRCSRSNYPCTGAPGKVEAPV